VQLDGVGIPNASVLLNVVAPGQSSNNFIASTPVSAALLERARAALSKEDVTAVGIKSFAIGLKGVAFNDFKRTLNIPMTDPGKSGVYSASIDETSVPEGYEFYVTAVGLLPTGEAFRRERRASKNVDVIPVREFTLVDVVYATGQATVRIIPKDKLGNFMPLFDPQFNPRIGITATGGAELRGGLTFNGDGSYSGTLVYPPTANPVIQVSVDGNVLVPSFPLQPVAEMIWVDQVVAFKLGSEAKPGANTHKDPGAALGDPLTKDPNLFVSLGGGGSLTVEIKGQVILNTGGSEITVFVEPDSSLRAYKVEAGYAGNQWVTLGTSSGITESFSFGKLSAARAIRISDLSVQIRDVDLNPLATPGVSVRAVGVKSTTKDSGGGGTGDICLRIRALNPKREPLGGTVDIEFRPVEVGPFVKVEKVDASKDIDVSGLQRTPQGLYEVTVIPNDVFKPTGQFVTVPASGFATVEFIIDKTK
jgi:hypothetical protein